MLEIKANKKKKAAELLKKGIELGLKGLREVEHGTEFLLHSLGTLELDNRHFEEAKKVFETGVLLYPKHSHLLLGLALSYMKLGFILFVIQ